APGVTPRGSSRPLCHYPCLCRRSVRPTAPGAAVSRRRRPSSPRSLKLAPLVLGLCLICNPQALELAEAVDLFIRRLHLAVLRLCARLKPRERLLIRRAHLCD